MPSACACAREVGDRDAGQAEDRVDAVELSASMTSWKPSVSCGGARRGARVRSVGRWRTLRERSSAHGRSCGPLEVGAGACATALGRERGRRDAHGVFRGWCEVAAGREGLVSPGECRRGMLARPSSLRYGIRIPHDGRHRLRGGPSVRFFDAAGAVTSRAGRPDRRGQSQPSIRP